MGKTFNKVLGTFTGANDAQHSTKQAMNAQNNATASSRDVVQNMYGTSQQYQSPFAAVGYDALPYLQSAILGKPADTYKVDPMTGIPTATGQQVSFAGSPMSFTGMQQQKQYNRALASRGLLGSGQAATGSADIAAQDAEQQIARLMSLLGIGQGASNNLSNMATNYGSQVANINSNQANQLGSLYGQQGQIATSYSPWNMGMQAGQLAARFVPFGGGAGTPLTASPQQSLYSNGGSPMLPQNIYNTMGLGSLGR
jgi:hypothetical protein